MNEGAPTLFIHAPRRSLVVERARRLLAQAPDRPHRLRDLARAVGVSPSHLSHVFHAEVGMPPHRYLLQLRMSLALERLRGGERDLSRLALDLGFSTHSHFSAAFRRAFGVSPSVARRALLAQSGVADLVPGIEASRIPAPGSGLGAA